MNSFPEAGRGGPRAHPRAAAHRGAPGGRGSAPRRSRAAGAVEAAPRPAEGPGAVHRRTRRPGCSSRPRQHYGEIWYEPRRPPRDEPHDDGRGRARNDLLARGRHAAAGRRRRDLPRASARGAAEARRRGVLRHLAGAGRRRRRHSCAGGMHERSCHGGRWLLAAGAVAAIAPLASRRRSRWI